MTNKRKSIQIDRDNLRAAVRKLGNEYMFYMLDDAIELLSPPKLHKIAKKYLNLDRLVPDAEHAKRPSLIADVKRFEKASLDGEYYESFFVDSKNYRQQSAGTSAWIAEFGRHLDRCVVEAKKGQPTEVREAMDILFALLDRSCPRPVSKLTSTTTWTTSGGTTPRPRSSATRTP